jgi:hypothetical protein
VGFNDYADTAFDGVVVMPSTVSTDVTLKGFPPVLVTGSLELDGANLSLTKGSFFFDDDAGLRLANGALYANAVSFLHVDALSGGWKGLSLEEGTEDSVVQACEFGYGGSKTSANLVLWSDATVRGSLFHDSPGYGILVAGSADPILEDNSFENNAMGDIGP